MFIEVSGDILLSDCEAIVQGIAPNDDFKHGLAFSLKEKWPELYKDFRHFSHAHHPKEGTLWKWKGNEGPTVFNLFTQEHAKGHNSNPGKAESSYVNHSLKELKKEIEKNGIKSIALPKLATGVGGMNWDEVHALIKTHLNEIDCKVILYTNFQKDEKALEN